MKTIKQFSQIIKDKRKNTPYKQYVNEILSWVPMDFYKNNGEISRFPETERSPKVISNKDFAEQRDEMMKYGMDHNSDKSFFENFGELFKNIPMTATIQQMNGENTKYSDMVVESKDTYLSNIVLGGSEDVYYSFSAVLASKNIFSSCRARQSEIIYNTMGADNSNKIFYSKYITNCNNIWFSSNLVGCSECLFCSGLDNSKYHISNKKYSKQEYFKKKEELFSHKDKFEQYYSNIKSKPRNVACVNCEGILLNECENLTNAQYMANIKDGNNLTFGGQGERFYDVFDVGYQTTDLYGAVSVGTTSSNIYCSNLIETCYNIFYCYNLNNCNHCFGCINLINKSYSILNKQYSKQDWETKVQEIMNSMEKEGNLGKFFPASLNPFYLNNTLAYFMGEYSQEKSKILGLLWSDDNKNSTTSEKINISKYINSDGIISSDIVDIILTDGNGKQYTLIQKEVDFLNKYNLPIPLKHWSERLKKHLNITK